MRSGNVSEKIRQQGSEPEDVMRVGRAAGKQTRSEEGAPEASGDDERRGAAARGEEGKGQRAGDWEMEPSLTAALGLGGLAASNAQAAHGEEAMQRKAKPRRATPAWCSTEAVQARGELGGEDIRGVARQGVAEASSPLPFQAEIQRSFGPHDVSGIRAQIGGAASSASRAIGAEAYAMGERVAFDRAPDLHTAAHEAAHVVQQRAGVQLDGGVGRVGDAYERNADAVADRVVQGLPAHDLLPGGTGSEAHGGARDVQRKPGTGKGGRTEKIVRLPDKTLFERKAYTPKPVSLLDSGELTFIDKIIWVWDVPLRVKVTGNANLVGSFSGGIGAAMLSNSLTYFDMKSLGPGELVKLGLAELAGHDVADAMMVLFMNQEGDEYTVTSRADLPVDATANLNAQATLKGEIGDPLLLVAVGAWGSLSGNATATAKANAGMQVKAKYQGGKWTLEGAYDLDFYMGLFLSLSATLGAYVRLGHEGEQKVKATQPKGMALVPPADWPADVPFHGDELADGDNPLAWKKEWRKTWPLWQKHWDRKWKVAGTFNLLGGGSDGDVGMSPEAFPVGDVMKAMIDSPSDDQIPERDPGPEPEKGPDAGRLAEAEAQTRLAVDKAKGAVDREADWNDEALRGAGTAAAYKAALDERKLKLDGYKRACISLIGKQHTAQRNARSGDGPTRREALAQFNGIKASSDELRTKAEALAVSRPKRINKYNAAKNGVGAKGKFSDFPDWIGYSMGVSSHVANRELGLGGNGSVPQPSGPYEFARGGDTTKGAESIRGEWKTRMRRELRDEKSENGGDESAAQAKLTATYGRSWDDLTLVDWDGHHIHGVSWGGAQEDRSNLIFIRKSEHSRFTAWWTKRAADILSEVAKDEP
jgi:Domain of unknown function (DUF4157)